MKRIFARLIEHWIIEWLRESRNHYQPIVAERKAQAERDRISLAVWDKQCEISDRERAEKRARATHVYYLGYQRLDKPQRGRRYKFSGWGVWKDDRWTCYRDDGAYPDIEWTTRFQRFVDWILGAGIEVHNV